MEEWKNINNYEGLYQISNYGRVKSLEREVLDKQCGKKHIKEKILSQYKQKGYLRVILSKNGKNIKPFVHILVAQHFIPNTENKPDVHHIDHNKENNHIDNLMWVTKKQHADLHPEKFEKMAKTAAKVLSRTILQIDKTTNEVIAEYSSAKEVERKTGFNYANIVHCCRGEIKTSRGYIWRYKNMFS